jgi:chemotaxis protein CheD
MRRIAIVQGEHAVVTEPGVVITTLLGSCVAVCLHDAVARVGGMNHFLLGEPGAEQLLRDDEMSRYGVHAMELLINAMMARGAVRQRLRARIFGGANIIAGLGAIGSENAAFARRFMAVEGIATGVCDLGGTTARRVEFRPWEGQVRSIRADEAPPLAPLPHLPLAGDIDLF